MWFAVHAFHYFQYKDGIQDEYSGWENIYLIEAENVAEARMKGLFRAKADEGDSEGTLTVNGRPATVVLGGILKLVDCIDLDLVTDKPVNGTEVSYTDLTLPSKEEFEKFVSGKTATVVYQGFDEDNA
jgi:hypothetical protein